MKMNKSGAESGEQGEIRRESGAGSRELILELKVKSLSPSSCLPSPSLRLSILLSPVLGLIVLCFTTIAFAGEQPADQPAALAAKVEESPCAAVGEEYAVGPDDILEFNVMRPELIQNILTVTADGSISVPYIGNVFAKGKSLKGLQKEIADKLGNGYMKYPVVTLTLRESRSRKFFIYGEVAKPGSYPMEENMTVFRALAVAGGFTRFGSSSKVKILRPKTLGPGYDQIKVDIKAVMDGKTDADVLLKSADVVVVSEGIF